MANLKSIEKVVNGKSGPQTITLSEHSLGWVRFEANGTASAGLNSFRSEEDLELGIISDTRNPKLDQEKIKTARINGMSIMDFIKDCIIDEDLV